MTVSTIKKASRKSLSVLLAVIMLMSSMSVCFSTVAFAAAAGTVDNQTWGDFVAALKNDTVKKAQWNRDTPNNYIVTDPDGKIIEAVELYFDIFSVLADKTPESRDAGNRTINQVNTTIKETLESEMGSEDYEAYAISTFIDNMLSGVFVSAGPGEGVENTTANSTTAPGTNLDAVADVNLTVSLGGELLSYDSIDDLPSEIATTKTFTVKHTNTYYDMSVSRTEDVKDGCGNVTGSNTYYKFEYYYSISDVSETEGKKESVQVLKDSAKTLSDNGTYLTADKATMIGLIREDPEKVAAAEKAINKAKSDAVEFSSAAWNQYFSADYDEKIAAFNSTYAFAAEVVSLEVLASQLNTLKDAGYDKNNEAALRDLYAVLAVTIAKYEGGTYDARAYLESDEYVGFEFDLAAVQSFAEEVLAEIYLIELRQLKAEIDATTEPYYEYTEEMITAGTLTGEMVVVAKGDVGGFISAIGTYPIQLVSQVMRGYTEMLTALSDDLAKLIAFAGADDFSAQYSKYVAEIYSKTSADASTEDLVNFIKTGNEDVYGYDDWYAGFSKLLNDNADKLGEGGAAKILAEKDAEMKERIGVAYETLEARVEAELDNAIALYEIVAKLNGKIDLINLSNYAKYKIAFEDLDRDTYEFLLNSEDFELSEGVITKYNNLNKDFSIYEKFLATGGFGYFSTINGEYVDRDALTNDFVRDENDIFTVNKTKVENVISGIDNLITSDEVSALLGSLLAAEGEEAADFNLGSMLEDLVADMLFTDEFINTVVQMLYSEILKALLNVWEKDLPNLANDMGQELDGLINKDLPTIVNDMGLALYPKQLAASLKSIDDTRYADNITKLNSVANEHKATVFDEDNDGEIDEVEFEYTPWDKEGSAILNEDGTLNLTWGVNDYKEQEGVTTDDVKAFFYARFDDAFTALAPLFFALIGNKDWSGTSSDAAKYIVDIDLKLYASGNPGYANMLVPIYEALGAVVEGTAGATFTYKDPSTIEGYKDRADSVGLMLEAILEPIFGLLDELGGAPLSTVINMLPNLCYALSFQMLNPLLNQLKTSIRVALDAGSFANMIIRNCDRIDIDLDNVYTKDIAIGDILGDINELIDLRGGVNSLLSMLGLPLPELDQLKVAQMGKLTQKETKRTDYIYSGAKKGYAYFIEADKGAVMNYLLQYIFGIIEEDNALPGLLGMLMTKDVPVLDAEGNPTCDDEGNEVTEAVPDEEKIAETIATIKGGAFFQHGKDNAVAAVVELFNPVSYADNMAEMDWVESQYNYNGIEGVNQATLMYLDYSNDWTKAKADDLIENLDALVSSILEMTGAEETDVNALIKGMIDGLFTAETITSLVESIASLGTALDSLLGEDAAIDIDLYSILASAGVDLKVVSDAFAYLYVTDLDRIEEGFVEPLKPGETGYKNDLGITASAEYELLYKTDENGEYILTEPLYEQELLVDADGNAILDADNKEQYVDIWVTTDADGKLVKCTETDAGARRIQKTKVVVTWSYGGAEFADGDRATFVPILTKVLSGFTPILMDLLKGRTIKLLPYEVDNTTKGAIEILTYNGYSQALALLLEALGIDVISQTEFNALSDAAALEYIINTLLGKVDELLIGSAIKNIIGLLPNLFYFLESNGLSVVIQNLLMPVLVLLDTIRPIFDISLNNVLSRLVSDLAFYGEIDTDNILGVITGEPFEKPVGYETITVNIRNLTIKDIINIVDQIFGTALVDSQLGIYGLQGFCSGLVEYDTVSSDKAGYRSTIDAADAITILVSALLEALQSESETAGKTNGDVLCEFIQEKLNEGAEEGETPTDVKAIYAMVIDLIKGVPVEYQVPNWGYMLKTEILPGETNIKLPEHTINYLDYSTDWTEDKAQAVEQTLDTVIKMILESTAGEGATIATLLNGVFNDRVYTDANLTAIVEALVNLLGGLDEALRNTIGVVIDADIASWFAMCEQVPELDEDGNAVLDEEGNAVLVYKVKEDKDWGVDEADDKKTVFIAGLKEVLAPANRLLSWFLFGDSYEFFTSSEKDKDGNYTNDIITLNGGRAYDYALVPILEALGVTMPKADTFIGADGRYDVTAAIEAILNSVFNLIDEVSANPTKGVLELLPNLLYFINADGIKTSVNNILAPIDALLVKVAPMIPDLNGATSIAALLKDTLGFDISNLSMQAILGLIYDNTDLVMSEEMIEILLAFYIGELEKFDSANGNDAYRLAYTTEEDYHDMLTIVLAFAIDLVKQNEAVFTELLGENGAQIYGAIKALLTPYNLTYSEIDWGYMYGNEDVADNTAALEAAGKFKPVEKFQYLKYSTDWTPETAENVYGELNSVITYILGEIADGNSIAQLLQGVMEDKVYTEANLKTVVELLVNALASLDRSLADTIGILLDADISTWFDFCEEQEVDGETKYVCTKVWGVDTAADKKAVFVDAIQEILVPANRLLNWLFFEGTFTFFKDATGETLITLTGGKGYELGLVPILEALGCDVEAAETFYDAQTGLYDVGAAVESILDSVLALVDEISANPAKEAMTLIPNLLYFINADGLKASVNNLLAPVEVLLSAFGGLLSESGEAVTLSSLIGFELDNLSTETLLGLLEGEAVGLVMNADMKAVIENIFALGVAEAYTSANGKTAYRVDVDGKEYDVLTVVLSFAIDAFKLNKALFADLLPEGVYDAIVTLIAGLNVASYDINWAYMHSGSMAELERSGFPTATINYLAYTTNWTPATANSVYGELADVLQLVLDEFIEDGDLKKLVTDLIAGNLYKTENLETIVELIVNAIAGFDASLRNVVDAVLDVNIADWFAMCAVNADGKYEVIPGTLKGDTREDFIAGLKRVLEPANGLLAWFFFGEEYTFFNGTTSEVLITVNGGNGYAYGIVPILEALGLEMKSADAYKGADGKYDVATAVADILNNVLDFVDAKLTSNEATVEFAFTLIPNLLYFINADGLKASVNNLVAPVDAIIGALSDVVGEESLAALLTDVIGIDISNLDTNTLLGLLVDNTGFVMNEGMTEAIYKIYEVGDADDFTSANGKVAYRVDVREYDALTVILSFAIDAFKLNKDLFAGLLPEGVYDAIVTLIAGLNIETYNINWAYMYDGDEGKLEEYGFPEPTIKYLEYSTDWTPEVADSVYGVLADVLDLVLPSVIEDGDLKKLVTDLIAGNLYKTENLETIVELIVNAIAGFDVSLRNVVDAVLDVNIASWFEMCAVNADGKYEVIPGTLKGDTREDFIAGIKTVLEPADELLAWLFFGKQYTFFNGTTSEVLITINGGNGYAYGILPILEALGVEGLQKEYNSVADAVADILNKVLDLVDAKLTSNEATVEFVLTLIPNLLYFINADGLKASVNNLVAPVDAIIGALSDVVGEESLAALLTDVIGIDISNLDTNTLLGLLVDNTGFVMNEGMTEAIYKIYEVGEAEKFTSVNGKTAYRLNPDMGDTLTVILSFALDAFNLNEELFAGLLGEEEYKAVYNLIRGAEEQFVYTDIDWGYMFDGEELADRLAALEKAEGKLPNYPANSTAANYLLYGNNWNKETAEYVNTVVDAVVDGIMGETSLGQMLDNAITNGFYQDSILDSLIEMVVGLLIDYAAIVEGAGALLGAESIKNWFSEDYVTVDADGNVTCVKDWGVDATVGNDAKRAVFIEAFVEVFEPAYDLLAWLLFDQEYTFFNGTTNDPLITITGGRGYEEAIVPLFEAVGAKMPGTTGTYVNGESAIKPASAYVTANGVDMEAAVRDMFSALTDWLYMLCGDLQNPGEYGVIGAMLDLLPNVVYNFNAGTLKAVVQNLLVPVEEILGHLEAFGLTVDFSSLIEIRGYKLDIKNLDWYSVFDIVEVFKLYWPDNIQDFLATLYLGEAVAYKSANGETAYHMTYNAGDESTEYLVSGRDDMMTLVISFVIDGVLDERNEYRLSNWLGADIYNVIMAYLTKTTVTVPMQDVDWALTEYADTGKVVSPLTLGAKINSEFYGELYTREMGEYIEKWLPSFVDTMIVLLGVQDAEGVNYEGLEDILNDLIGDSLYTTDNLNAVLDLIKGLIPMAEEALGAELFEVVVNVLNKALEIDLTYWDNYTVDEITTGDRDAFVNELTEMFVPLYPILSWLLTDEELIALFHIADGSDAIVIEGAEGYAYGIIPLLEAFDYDSELILTPDEFKAASTDAPAMLKNILNPLLDVVDKVLADPVNELFNVLPGVIYFLNSNGLDTVIKNTANAVFTVLENIEPLIGELDIYELIGFDAENINIETLISELIKGLEEDTGFQLTEVAMEALKELTVGTVKSYTSKNGKLAYTVEYATGADRVDMVTVVLRTVLTFVSIPENVVALEGMLEGKLNEDGYKFVCSLLENFSQMAASEGGMDEIMYTVYQIFYAANVAAHSTEDWLAEFNGDYSFLNQLFATSDLAFLRQLEVSLGDLLNKYTGDIIDDNEIVPNGFIAFFQKIADFFKKIGEFFKNLFK